MKEFWDSRYQAEEYVYGVQPNAFFREFIDNRPPGKLFLPGEGEGRNAVYAASAGWEVDACDFSSRGREKALGLAKERGVRVNKYLQTIEFLLSPDVIIVGGGVSESKEKFFPFLDLHARLLAARMGNDAGIVGAALAVGELQSAK